MSKNGPPEILEGNGILPNDEGRLNGNHLWKHLFKCLIKVLYEFQGPYLTCTEMVETSMTMLTLREEESCSNVIIKFGVRGKLTIVNILQEFTAIILRIMEIFVKVKVLICELLRHNRYQRGFRLNNLFMYLDDKVYLKIRNMKNLLTDYEDLCDFRTNHNSGILTEDAASYKLELLLSRRTTKLSDFKIKCFICQNVGYKKYKCSKRNKKHTNSVEVDTIACSNIVSNRTSVVEEELVNGYNTVVIIDTRLNEVVLNSSLAHQLHLKLTSSCTSIKSFQMSHRAKKCFNSVEIRMLHQCYMLENIFVPDNDLSNSLYQVVIDNSILRRLNTTMNLTTGERSKINDDEPLFENSIKCT
uniref:DDE Tnp4 domain-containing protein n=1 Tax=Strongyloides venezuelensis TaxID=75913 RepID=A0A0K0F272_STRVS